MHVFLKSYLLINFLSTIYMVNLISTCSWTVWAFVVEGLHHERSFIWLSILYFMRFSLLWWLLTLLQTMSEIKRQNEDALLKAFQVDLLSIQSILNFKNSLQLWLQDSKMHPSVQLLINNAGILATSSRITSEGYDQLHICSLFLF